MRNYEVNCRVHFVPSMGDLHLSEIRSKHIDDYKQQRASTAKHSTVNLELVLLRSILNAAVTRGYLKENPAKSIPPIRVPGAVRVHGSWRILRDKLRRYLLESAT